MHRSVLRQALWLGLLVTFVLGVSACGGEGDHSASGQQHPKERTLPNLNGPLPPGRYSSQEFKPQLSLTLGKGWTLRFSETTKEFDIMRTGPTMNVGMDKSVAPGITFLHVQQVYNYPSGSVSRAPDDMASWLEKHPDLHAASPVPTKVGGVHAVRIDTQRPSDDVLLFPLGQETEWGVNPKSKFRFIVVNSVKGKTVIIAVGGPAGQFEELLPKAQEVLGTVKWEGT